MNKDNQQGFTLIEVMISLIVLAVGILAVTGMHYSAINGNVSARNLTTVCTYAAGQLETIMGMPYADPLLAAGDYKPEEDGDDDDGNGQIDDDMDDGVIGARVSWTVVDDTPAPGTKTITITVSTDEGGSSNSVTFSYIKATET